MKKYFQSAMSHVTFRISCHRITVSQSFVTLNQWTGGNLGARDLLLSRDNEL